MTPSPPAPISLSYATLKVGEFVSIKRLGGGVQVLLAANIFIALVAILTYYWQVELIQTIQLKAGLAPGQADANDIRVRVITALSALLIVANGIVFLLWVHRATANLRCFSREPLRFTAGWAVGWFFVPLMNLVRAPQVIKQIWIRSSYPERPDTWTPAVVGWCWGCWLLAGLTQRIATALGRTEASLDQLLAASWTAIGAKVIYIAAFMCAIAIVRRIDQMQ